MWHPADPVCTFKTGAPVTVLSGEGNGSVQRCPFYWHITTLTFSWSKLHYVPHGLHLLLAFEASVDDIYREALHDSPYTPTCEMRLLLQGQKTPYCTTSKMAWRHKHMALLHQRCFYIFVSNCSRASWYLQSGWWNFTLKEANVLIYSKVGAFDNGTFSSPSKVL